MAESALVLAGIGLRAPHYQAFLESSPNVAWVEVHSENYFGDGGKSLQVLEKIRCRYPVSLHGVGLSLGSADELNWHHVKKLHDLAMRINPCLISEHLSWSSIQGRYFHDLLPLPYTEQTLQHLVTRIQQIQDYLKRQILIENISSYVCCEDSVYTEQDFLTAVVKQSGCGILLDINNLYVNATNLGYDPHAYLAAISSDYVQEIHLAGFTTTTIDDKEVLIDSHDCKVSAAVWNLYRQALQQLGIKPTIIEWDAHLPVLEALCLEAYAAEKIMRENHVTTKLSNSIC